MNIKQEIVDSISILVKTAIEKTCPVITFGLVSQTESNKCTVLINQIEHKIKYYGGTPPTVNQKYPVFVPFNNMSLAFIITSGSGGGSTSDIAWLPMVDASGNISWTRSSTTTAPITRNIKGEKGDKGDTGVQGEQGIQGEQGEPGTFLNAPAERARRIFYGATDAASYYSSHGLTPEEGDVYVQLQ